MFSREMMEVKWGGCDGCNRAYQNIPSTPWASYQIRKIAGCACAGNTGKVFPATDFEGNRQARAFMHVEIANLRWQGKRSRYSRRMRNP